MVCGELNIPIVHNAGVAFGVALPLQDILVFGALIMVSILAYHARHIRTQSIGFGLILGGALANIIDRADDGLVTDFVRIGAFPTFNVADSCITVGVAFLLALELRSRYHIPSHD